ncbi:hypothetical protein [Geoalkalibacter subterraneus]|uniref:hypothetical protein n=1 Tax=Geoalkalibacter subterraneus TaxID=483547 RepID=UPI001184DDBD|nr:hypothetical protein [Geoalkalibacter subterraneus]
MTLKKLDLKSFCILLLFLGFVSLSSPDYRDHFDVIELELKKINGIPGPSLYVRAPWDDLIYKDLSFFSFTKSSRTGDLVSVGFLNWVFVLDTRWSYQHTVEKLI